MFYKMFLGFRKSTQRNQQLFANFKGFAAIFISFHFKIVTKNIANMHLEQDVSDFFKHRLKIASLRIWKHCIASLRKMNIAHP